MASPSRPDRQLEILGRMTPDQKLALAAELRETSLRLLAAGILMREPKLSPADLRLRVLRCILPPRLYDRFYAPGR